MYFTHNPHFSVQDGLSPEALCIDESLGPLIILHVARQLTE
jgi:hypothetical protein